MGRRTSGRATRRTRVSTRLVALALVPLVGMGSFAAFEAAARWRLVRGGAAVAKRVDQLADVLPISLLVSREVYVTGAAATAKNLGLTPAQANALTGLDLDGDLVTIRAALAQRFDRLDPGDRALRHRAKLEQLRQAMADGSLAFGDGMTKLAALAGEINDEGLATLRSVSAEAVGLGSPGDLQQAISQLEFGDLAAVSTAEQLGGLASLFQLLTKTDRPSGARDLRRATAKLEIAQQDLDVVASGRVGTMWRRLQRDPVVRSGQQELVTIGESDVVALPQLGPAELAGIFGRGMTRLARFYDLTDVAANTARHEANDMRDAAMRRLGATLAVATALLMVTLAAATLIARSIARPLRRLATSARQVSTGELDDVALPDRGPRELHDVAATFGEVVANVRRVEAQVGALAAGDLDDGALRDGVPGRLGKLLHDSVARLSRSLADREELAAQLRHEATHDALTGLPNRTAATHELARVLARDRRPGTTVGVLYVDLDNFKHVNDNHGHDAGDTVLRVTAQRLRATVHPGDFVARIGGDEFLVVTERASPASDLVALGRRLVAALTEPIAVGAGVTRTGASIGIALTAHGDVRADDLLRDADVAAYRAKAGGRGRVEIFDDALRAEVQANTDVERALRHALVHDELELHFQPVVHPSGAEVSAVEALLRWNRPGVGMVAPAEFIPIAESSDLIIEIGRWVLDEACRHLAAWRGDRVLRPLDVAVNLSGRHLLSLTVVDDVREALDRHGVAPAQLTVEITETVLLADVALIVENIRTLRELGVRVAIDDFGTGYTSLTHLRSLPVDVLKIDRSLVVSGAVQPDAHVLRLVTGTARALGLHLVAEGVETEEQLDRMRDLGCDAVQGFLFSRPVPARELRATVEVRTLRPAPTGPTVR